MKRAWFIAGTDTEIGKTFITCALLHHARALGHQAVGMKPIAAGTDATGNNEDVDALLTASSGTPDPALVNPYRFAPPIAPHIAAAEAGVAIDFAAIQQAFSQLKTDHDTVFVEGVGGFCVPLGPAQDAADLAQALGLPIILVVGMRLGCINHALLTVEAITRRGLPLAGWVANQVDPQMQRFEENVEALRKRIAAPLLGIVPRLADADPAEAAACLRLP